MHATTVNNWPRGTSLLFGNLFSDTLGIRSVIPRQWYNILNQRNLCHRSATLHRFLHISTISTTANALPLFGAHLATQQLLNTRQSTCLSAACNLHVTSENHHRFKNYTHCFQRFSVVSKENRLQTRIRCAIIADLMLQISTNSLAFPDSYV